MGRLFWKFFFILLLAQVVTALGVGVAVWLTFPAHSPGQGVFESMSPLPPPGVIRPPLPLSPPSAGEPRRYHVPVSPPFVPIIAGSFVSLLFAALLALYFARPIRTLRAAFESVAGGELDTRIGASMGRRNDELADLGNDFDKMVGRLQKLIETQRRLLHDVSHELRSPLARLQAAADLIRQQPERGAEFVERIERDAARMNRLVGELLTLARLDTGMAGKLDGEVDLCEVVADIVEDARLEADSKHCRIEVELKEPLVARGDFELLYRAIENVVRNAVFHSPESGIVTVSAHAVEQRLRVTVADAGPGVPNHDIAVIFEPFFRSDPSGTATGYGLGLAITRSVVEAHDGTVSATNRAEGGLLMTLELPNRQSGLVAGDRPHET